MENERSDFTGPVGVTPDNTIGGWDPPRQVIGYELRDGRIFATWIAPSGALTTGEVPLFKDGDGHYNVFGEKLRDEEDERR